MNNQGPSMHDVIVRKDVKLFTNESVGQFTKQLADESRKWVRQQLNLSSDQSAIYPIEVFSKAMILDVFQYGKEGRDEQRYFACSYSRKDTGVFEFSTLTEVERVTSFQPKQNSPVTKSEEVDIEKAPLSTAAINDLPDAAFAIILPGGKKDPSGRTIPKTLRIFPHHTRNVQSATEHSTIDVPRLRNALARLNQAKINPQQRARAGAHLNRHAKAVLASRGGNPGRIDPTRGNRAGAKPVKKALDVCDGWVETQKNFWSGVL